MWVLGCPLRIQYLLCYVCLCLSLGLIGKDIRPKYASHIAWMNITRISDDNQGNKKKLRGNPTNAFEKNVMVFLSNLVESDQFIVPHRTGVEFIISCTKYNLFSFLLLNFWRLSTASLGCLFYSELISFQKGDCGEGGNSHLMSNYHMLDTLYMFSHLILTTALKIKYYYYHHFTVEKNKY